MNIIKTLWRVMLTKSGEGYFDGVVSRIGVAISLLIAGKVSITAHHKSAARHSDNQTRCVLW
jgi:hypothetical protein